MRIILKNTTKENSIDVIIIEVSLAVYALSIMLNTQSVNQLSNRK